MSYICEFCSFRPENCACSADITEPRLENELTVADNIMAVQRPYGLLDAPSPADFFSLLVELEKEEKYDSPTLANNDLLIIPKLERQTNRPHELVLSEEELKSVSTSLFPEEKLIPDANFYQVSQEQQPINYISLDQLSRETYSFEPDYCSYDYYNVSQDYHEDHIKCSFCEQMIDSSEQEQYGMCYFCFMTEQIFDTDDIQIELPYNSDKDSF